MSDLTATIQRVLDLDAQATKGPWETDGVYDLYVYRQPRGNGETIADRSVEHDDEAPAGSLVRARGTGAGLTEAMQAANMRLVAEYRTAAPDLARALVAEQGRVADLEAQLAKERERSGDAEARYTTSIRAHEATAQERDALRTNLARVTAARDRNEREVQRLQNVVCYAPACSAAIVRHDDGSRVCAAGHPARWVNVDLLTKAEADLAAARQDAEALRALLREARDRLLDDAALLHRTGMTSESTKHALAADKARQMAERIAAAIGSGS